MINANELRIGNWVKVNDNYIKVIDIDFHGINISLPKTFYDNVPPSKLQCSYSGFFEYDRVKITPIPLTPEILEQCGFNCGDDDSMNDYHLNDFRVAFHIHDGVVEFRGERIYEFIPPLHQLQNLYFVLTGEELKVNLNVAANQ